MSIIGTIIGTGIGIAIGGVVTKKLDEKKKMERKLEKVTKIGSEQTAEYKKGILDIIREIAYANELEKFTLMEYSNGISKYQYLKNGFLITVRVSEDIIECDIQKEKEVLLEFVYDLSWNEYDKKVVKRSVIENGQKNDSMSVVEDFMYEINEYDWGELDDELIIVDDMKGVTLIDLGGVPNEPEILDDEEVYSTINQLIAEDTFDKDLSEQITSTINAVKKVTVEMKNIENQIDVEAKHIYDSLIRKDLPKLFAAYSKLEEKKRVHYQDEMVDSLHRIQNKAFELLRKIQSKNIYDVESILHVIKQRYEK